MNLTQTGIKREITSLNKQLAELVVETEDTYTNIAMSNRHGSLHLNGLPLKELLQNERNIMRIREIIHLLKMYEPH